MSSRFHLSVAACALVAAFAPAAVAQQAIELDTVTIDANGNQGNAGGASDIAGGAATGPVNGYVAKRTTTGSKTGTPLVEVPQSVSVIGRQELDDRGVQKVDEALRYTPGVFSQPFGQDTDTDWIYIRGFNATQTGAYLDGLNLYSYAFGGFIIDPFLLERVEVLRGPASVLYGGSNPGGLVNSVSKRATGERIAYVEGAINDDPNGYGAFDLGDKITEDGAWSYRVLGKLQGGDTDTEFAQNFRGLIAPNLTFQPDADTRLNLYATYQYDDQNHVTGFLPYVGSEVDAPFGKISRDIFYSEPDLDSFLNRQGTVGYEFETDVSENARVVSNTRYGHSERSEYGPYFFGYYNPATGFGGLTNPVAPDYLINRLNFAHDTKVDTVTTDNRLVVESDPGLIDHQFMVGIDYKYFGIDQVQASGVAAPLNPVNPIYTNSLAPLSAPYLNEKIDLNQLGFYAQEQAKFGGGFILTLNGRYDQVWIDRNDRGSFNNDYSGDEGAASGRAGLAYEFKNGLVPYASVSRFFNPQIGTNAQGDAVEPEVGEQYEVGLKYAPTFVDAVFTASLFDLTRRNTLQSVAPLFIPQAIGEINSQGVELEANVNIDRNWKIKGAFTAFDLTIERDANENIVGNRPFLVPEVQASAWADYTVAGGSLDGLGGGVGVRYVGDSYADNENEFKVDASTVFDAALRYNRDNWGVSANVTNVFDKKAVSGCQNTYACGYIEGRGVLFKGHVSW
ncbi:TonB-dependent siderophore receptor [Aureimonas psammosilenae]|uniref:TonB-dependent siderophore receptor n=1 Tax=Aureimonas psammosilenae TaxID=2495496 RepID=UPI0012612730|nr:TonB-dependent siderophore receptor [Aureimonas psammosilenae]